jgi:hypothetical protein
MERWIAVRAPLASAFAHATDVLMDDAPSILPNATTVGDGTAFVDLTVEVPGRAGAVRHDVKVMLGVPCSAEGETWVPITWEPAGHARLLPNFDGVLEVVATDDGTELSITGTYRIPLGAVGRFGDGVIGRRIAQQSIRGLATRMAGEIDRHVERRIAHADGRRSGGSRSMGPSALPPVDASPHAERRP